jgi:hypothetical protein
MPANRFCQYEDRVVALEEFEVTRPGVGDVLFIAETVDPGAGYVPAITMIRKADFTRMVQVHTAILDSGGGIVKALNVPGAIAVDRNHVLLTDYELAGDPAVPRYWIHRLRWRSLTSAFSGVLQDYAGSVVETYPNGGDGLAVNWADFFWRCYDDDDSWVCQQRHKAGARAIVDAIAPAAGQFDALDVDQSYLYIANNQPGVAAPRLEKRAISDLATVVATFTATAFSTGTCSIRGVFVDDVFVYFQIYDSSDDSATLYKVQKDQMDSGETGLVDSYDMDGSPLDYAGLCGDEDYLYAVVNMGDGTATLYRLYKADNDDGDFGETATLSLVLVGDGNARPFPVSCLKPCFTKGLFANDPTELTPITDAEASAALELSRFRIMPLLYKLFSASAKLIPTFARATFFGSVVSASAAVTAWLKVVAPYSKVFAASAALQAVISRFWAKVFTASAALQIVVNLVAAKYASVAVASSALATARLLLGAYGLDYDDLTDDWDGVEMTPDDLTDDHEGGSTAWPD